MQLVCLERGKNRYFSYCFLRSDEGDRILVLLPLRLLSITICYSWIPCEIENAGMNTLHFFSFLFFLSSHHNSLRYYFTNALNCYCSQNKPKRNEKNEATTAMTTKTANDDNGNGNGNEHGNSNKEKMILNSLAEKYFILLGSCVKMPLMLPPSRHHHYRFHTHPLILWLVILSAIWFRLFDSSTFDWHIESIRYAVSLLFPLKCTWSHARRLSSDTKNKFKRINETRTVSRCVCSWEP